MALDDGPLIVQSDQTVLLDVAHPRDTGTGPSFDEARG